MCKYPWECWGSCLRLLPTAGVCDQRSGASLRLLLTAGVCEQRLGGFLRPLLTAGVCKQRFSLVLRPLLTAGICNQRLDAVRRHLPTTDVCGQRLGTVPLLLPLYLTFAYSMCMPLAHIICISAPWRLRDMVFPYFLLKKSQFQGALKNFNPFDLRPTL